MDRDDDIAARLAHALKNSLATVRKKLGLSSEIVASALLRATVDTCLEEMPAPAVGLLLRDIAKELDDLPTDETGAPRPN
jgi:hypothetical protein